MSDCPCTRLYRAYFASRAGLLAFRRMAAATNKRIISVTYGGNGKTWVRWASCQ